jgi:hypothetical protein
MSSSQHSSSDCPLLGDDTPPSERGEDKGVPVASWRLNSDPLEKQKEALARLWEQYLEHEFSARGHADKATLLKYRAHLYFDQYMKGPFFTSNVLNQVMAVRALYHKEKIMGIDLAEYYDDCHKYTWKSFFIATAEAFRFDRDDVLESMSTLFSEDQKECVWPKNFRPGRRE